MNVLNCDLLVVGGGAAGSRAAFEAKRAHPGLDVVMAVSGGFGTSGSTNLIASESLGINAPFNYPGDGDSPDVFYSDMIETGAGLADPVLCDIIAHEACARVEELCALGLRFDEEGGRPVQRKLSGCTKARSLTCGGSTGREIVRVLKEGIERLGVRSYEHMRVLDLVTDDEGRVRGALALAGKETCFIGARAIILASGGAGRIFKHHVNPPSLEGDAWSMAYWAGARLVNMEFFQIGPAIFNAPLMFIIHSHMWRLRPRLTNARGEEFLGRYCPSGITPAEVMDLKAMSYPFSVRTAAKYLDMAIFREVMEGRGTPAGAVYFDVTHTGRNTLMAKAPVTYETMMRAGIDLSRDRIEVGLVVQNFNGGIFIDGDGATGVEGLYAAGEASGGVHGADRPGGNNLIDTQVFGYRAGRAAAEYAAAGNKGPGRPVPNRTLRPPSAKDASMMRESEALFSSNLTVIRTAKGLREVLDFTGRPRGKANIVVRNRLAVGSLLATAALTREESRGTHYREDFPERDPNWEKRIVVSRGPHDAPRVELRS
jgi:fumarate reductase (CoM/CoB) subunit A